jgi:hypothetical protein
LTGSDCPDARNNLQHGAVLQDVAFGSQVHGSPEWILAGVHGKKDGRDGQVPGGDLTGDRESIQLRHVDIEHCDLGEKLYDKSERGFSIRRFTYDAEPASSSMAIRKPLRTTG